MVELNISDNFLHCIAVHLGICGILWVLIIAAILVDLWDRVYTNKKLGKKIESHKMRITLEKVSEYWRFMIIAFTIDMVTFISLLLFSATSSTLLVDATMYRVANNRDKIFIRARKGT